MISAAYTGELSSRIAKRSFAEYFSSNNYVKWAKANTAKTQYGESAITKNCV
jgi:hypothetical protein